MPHSMSCSRCGGTFIGEPDASGRSDLCALCRRETETMQESHQSYREKAAECSECRQLFPLARLQEHKGAMLCSRCLSIEHRKEAQALRKKRRITTEVALLIIVAIGAYFAKDYIWRESHAFDVTNLESTIDTSGNLARIKASFENDTKTNYDKYAVICTIDSTEDISAIAERLIKEAHDTDTGLHHLARWMPENGSYQCFLGTHGEGGIQWIDNARKSRRSGGYYCPSIDKNGYACRRYQWLNPQISECGYCVENIGIHAVLFFGKKKPEKLELNLTERDFGQFRIKGQYTLKTQVWCCKEEKWLPGSKILEKRFAKAGK